MTIQSNIDLQPYNTFKISATARFFTIVKSESEMREVVNSEIFQANPHVILGGGSNILLTGDFPGLVIKNEIRGIEVVDEDEDIVKLKVGSGEGWHDLVMFCVERNLGGIENLSLIPGTCGAAPMQNIGAYGVEVKQVIDEVGTINLETGESRVFSNEECQFGYRESIFKQSMKGKYFISSITLSATKRNHRFNTTYGAISDVLRDQHGGKISIKTISDSVIYIRKTKLPDPALIGNAGSFFKNPTITQTEFVELKSKYPAVPSFPGENGGVKIPAGWLIEQTGFKGFTEGNVGVHKLQALVLVNYGGGTGEQIWTLAQRIQQSVKEKFTITITPEVNVI